MSDDKKRVLKDISEGLSADTVLTSHREVHEHKEAMKSASGKLREARKRMEKNGVDLRAYDLAMMLSKLDTAEAITRLQRAGYILQSLRSPLGAQLGLIGLEDPNMPKTDSERQKAWYDEGFSACANGKAEKDCQHDLALPAGQAWLKGYRDCHSAAVKKQTDTELKSENKVDTVGAVSPPPPDGDDAPASAPAAADSKKPRGRPPGSKNKVTVVVDNTKPQAPSSEEPAGKTSGPAAPPSDDEMDEGFDAPTPVAAASAGGPPPPPMFD